MVASQSVPVLSAAREAQVIDYGAVFDAAPEPLAVVRVFGDEVLTLAANARLARALEVSAGEVCGKTLGEVFEPEATAAIESAVRRAASTGCPARVALRPSKRRSAGGAQIAAVALEKRLPARAVLVSFEPERETAVRAREQERLRIARNLHDSVAQHVVALELSLSSLERRPQTPEAVRPIIQDMRASLSALHREIRTYSYLMHPPHLKDLGLEAALSRFVAAFGRRSELAVEMLVQGKAQALPPDVELGLYRVAQEAIMNVHRHARAGRLIVRLTYAPERVTLEVEDDGVGLAEGDALARGDGVGIPGMQARLAQFGGALELERLPKGLCVRAELPLKA